MGACGLRIGVGMLGESVGGDVRSGEVVLSAVAL